MKFSSVTIQMKAIEGYSLVVLFIKLYRVDRAFETVNEILKCDHSNESYCMCRSFVRLTITVSKIKLGISVPRFELGSPGCSRLRIICIEKR